MLHNFCRDGLLKAVFMPRIVAEHLIYSMFDDMYAYCSLYRCYIF